MSAVCTYVHSRRALAAANHVDPERVVSDVDDIAARLPAALAAAADDDAVRELRSPLPALLIDRVAARSAQCRQDLEY